MEQGTRRAFYLGRYNCVERLGEGPLGESFRAKIYGVAGFEKQFCVERLRPDLCESEAFVARFVNAATAYAGLDHERIARVHEVNVQGAQYYVAVDLVRGLDLQRLLEVLHGRGEALPTDVATLIAFDLADALGHAHGRTDLLPSGVLHLGLAPRAVMVTTEGEVRVLDVALVSALRRPGWSDDDRLLPTLAYLAPETLGDGPVDARADVFSLGALLYEMLAGRRAFPGDRVAEVKAQIAKAPPAPPPTDARLQALLGRMLERDPAARLQAMGQVREALVAILGARANRARTDLGGIVRRIARPLTRTGAFPITATTAQPPPPPLQASAPRVASPPVPVPPPPIGPRLEPLPVRNTLAGVGPDDQVLVPIELVELPGGATAKELPAISDDVPTRPVEKLEHEVPTVPMEEVPPDPQMTGPLPALVPEASPPEPPPRLAPASVEAHVPAPLEPLPPTTPLPTVPPPTAAASAGMGTHVAGPIELPPPPDEHRVLKVALAVGALVALLIGGGIYLVLSDDEPPPAPPLVAAQPGVPVTPAPAVTQPVRPAPAPTPVEEPAAQATAAPAPAPAEPTAAQPTAAPAPSPTPIEPAAGNGNLAVATTPPGAAVYVDGEPRGRTPLALQVPAGAHKIVLLADGHKLRRESARTNGGVTQLNYTLEPAKLPSEIAGPAGLKVRCKTQGELRILVDGADTGLSCPNDTRIAVAPGTRKIGLYSPRTDQTYELEKEVEGGSASTRVYVKY